MKIIMDRRAEFLYQCSGMGTYSTMVWKFLQNLSSPPCRIQGLGELKKTTTDCFFWEHIMQERLSVPKCNIFFTPFNGIGNYVFSDKSCAVISTVHDIIPYIMPQTVGKGYKEIFYKQMPHILKNSAHIITVSHNTKEDLMRIGNIDESKITVIYCGVEAIFQPLPKTLTANFLHNYYGFDFPYILYVGGFSARKNVTSILQAFSRLNFRQHPKLHIVLVGKPSPNQEKLQKTSEKLNIADRVIYLQNLPPQDMPYLYNGASLFVYPSLYEGFGLPPLEAMACGTPVIAANNSSLPEVIGNAGILTNCNDIDDLAFNINLVLSSKITANAMSKRGILRAKGFSWQKNAEKTLKVFKKFAKFADI